MTINYTLYLCGSLTPKEVVLALAPDLPGAAHEKSDSLAWIWDGPVCMTAWRLEGRVPGIAEDNGVAANLGVDFQLITEESEEAKPVMLRHLMSLLSRFDGDAVFQDVAGNLLLRRREGKMELELSNTFWTSQRRGLVTGPG
jgi:hypothetical protein